MVVGDDDAVGAEHDESGADPCPLVPEGAREADIGRDVDDRWPHRLDDVHDRVPRGALRGQDGRVRIGDVLDHGSRAGGQDQGRGCDDGDDGSFHRGTSLSDGRVGSIRSLFGVAILAVQGRSWEGAERSSSLSLPARRTSSAGAAGALPLPRAGWRPRCGSSSGEPPRSRRSPGAVG